MCLLAVQRFENHSRTLLAGIVTQLAQLFNQIITRLGSVRHHGNLVVKCRHHNYACRTELSCRRNDFTHRTVEFGPHLGLLREDKSGKPGTNGADTDVTTAKSLFQFTHACRQVLAAGFKPRYTVCFHIVQPLGERFARRGILLKRQPERIALPGFTQAFPLRVRPCEEIPRRRCRHSSPHQRFL